MACFLGAGAILIVLLFVMGDALLAATAAVGIHSTGRGRVPAVRPAARRSERG